MKPRRAPHAAALPGQGFSHHAPVWWGNRFMIVLEGVAFAILLVTYFYIRLSSDT